MKCFIFDFLLVVLLSTSSAYAEDYYYSMKDFQDNGACKYKPVCLSPSTVKLKATNEQEALKEFKEQVCAIDGGRTGATGTSKVRLHRVGLARKKCACADENGVVADEYQDYMMMENATLIKKTKDGNQVNIMECASVTDCVKELPPSVCQKFLHPDVLK